MHKNIPITIIWVRFSRKPNITRSLNLWCCRDTGQLQKGLKIPSLYLAALILYETWCWDTLWSLNELRLVFCSSVIVLKITNAICLIRIGDNIHGWSCITAYIIPFVTVKCLLYVINYVCIHDNESDENHQQFLCLCHEAVGAIVNTILVQAASSKLVIPWYKYDIDFIDLNIIHSIIY